MKTVTDVNTVNQLLTYSKQAEAGIHQKAIQMLLGAGNNKKQDSLSISDAARGFSKQSIAALIDKNANISNSELAYYFANYNNSSAILDAINFGENVSCGYNSDFKEYGVISFDLNGSRQVVPNYAVPKMNTSTMSGICAANNSLVLSNKSYYSWTTSSGGKYTWTVNNGRIGWAASESLLAENTNQKGTNYKWEMRKASNILSDLAQGKSVWGYLYSNEEVLSVCEKVGISPGFFSIDAGAGKHTYLLQESGKTINVDAREAFGNLHGAYSRKDENWREYLDKYNEVLMDTEKNYTKEMEKLHQKQFESLPEEKQYKGGRTVDELLQDMAEGKTLDDAETEYVKIFANLKDFEKAQQKAELKNDFSEDFVKDLESKGISRDELEGMQIKIESNGNVTVSGIEDKEVREQVQKLVEEKYSDRMYQYYTGIADSVGNLSSNTYQYATDVQEVRRYLKGVTGEDISLENLYLTPDGKIGGLPGKAADLINKTKDNAKIERIKDALINIIGHNRTSGDLGIPDFTSEFQFSNGAFSVADSGFTVDMAALDRRLTPQPHDNMYSDMYAYSFRKVL